MDEKTEKQTQRWTKRQTERQTETQIEKQTERWMKRQTYKQKDGQKNGKTEDLANTQSSESSFTPNIFLHNLHESFFIPFLQIIFLDLKYTDKLKMILQNMLLFKFFLQKNIHNFISSF